MIASIGVAMASAVTDICCQLLGAHLGRHRRQATRGHHHVAGERAGHVVAGHLLLQARGLAAGLAGAALAARPHRGDDHLLADERLVGRLHHDARRPRGPAPEASRRAASPSRPRSPRRCGTRRSRRPATTASPAPAFREKSCRASGPFGFGLDPRRRLVHVHPPCWPSPAGSRALLRAEASHSYPLDGVAGGDRGITAAAARRRASWPPRRSGSAGTRSGPRSPARAAFECSARPRTSAWRTKSASSAEPTPARTCVLETATVSTQAAPSTRPNSPHVTSPNRKPTIVAVGSATRARLMPDGRVARFRRHSRYGPRALPVHAGRCRPAAGRSSFVGARTLIDGSSSWSSVIEPRSGVICVSSRHQARCPASSPGRRPTSRRRWPRRTRGAAGAITSICCRRPRAGCASRRAGRRWPPCRRSPRSALRPWRP